MSYETNNPERGAALISALLTLLVFTALAASVIYKVNTEQHLQKTDSGNNQAYYGAEAGMEKMMADLNALYAQRAAPDWCDITNLSTLQPSQSDVGVTYSEYQITIPNPPAGCTPPPSRVQTISQGPNAGLLAQIVPLSLQVSADRPAGEEVRMVRQVEVALIPVFQFGVFSQSDLSFFPGPDFDFNGRVHTNGNLFLASTSSLKFHSAIRAAGDVVRDQLANGADTWAQGRRGTVNIPTAPGGCDGAPAPACRDLTVSPTNEGSSIGGPTPTYGGTGVANTTGAGWTSISTSTYAGMILSGTTGAKPLSMAFVQTGVNPIEIIRRPLPFEVASSAVAQSRLYNQAQIRVLLSDDPAELPGGAGDPQNIRLANVQTAAGAPDYTNGVPVPGAANTYFAEGTTAGPGGEAGWANVPTAEPTLRPAGAPALSPTTWNLLDGYLRVEIRRSDNTFLPVTREWLELGFARGLTPPTAAALNPVHPNAILILQQPADRNGNGILEPAEMVTDAGTGSTVAGAATRNNWYPINFYETREGELREKQRASLTCFAGGVVNGVEIDVRNLSRWLNGTIGATGIQTEYLSQNGYVLYFSDRRGMLANAAGVKTGEYGFEDVINPASAAGTPNNILDSGEDVNASGTLETYGANDLGLGFGPGNSGSPIASVNCLGVARKNWVSGARHIVRLVNGRQGNVPVRPDNNAGGFTLASENPAYILGDYNANGAFGNPHASSSVIADTVTLLSNNWSDLRSFSSPTDVNGRVGTTTWYRVAIASGKNINFPIPGFAGRPDDFGTDGGVHNFLRYLENWGPATSNYMGSMVSLYYSQYGTGVFKCCGTVYSPPTRNYAFDLDFQDLSKMPPGTPKFRDVVSLGFQQVF
ncbi:MAG: hypothetical protein ACXVZM_02020 [Terriglobales bacterium]